MYILYQMQWVAALMERGLASIAQLAKWTAFAIIFGFGCFLFMKALSRGLDLAIRSLHIKKLIQESQKISPKRIRLHPFNKSRRPSLRQ